uniref:Uncharacterized protein n=1 Tax=Anopheles culicifacies TaxID=139723 RepID=A0A182LU69_9DIPT
MKHHSVAAAGTNGTKLMAALILLTAIIIKLRKTVVLVPSPPMIISRETQAHYKWYAIVARMVLRMGAVDIYCYSDDIFTEYRSRTAIVIHAATCYHARSHLYATRLSKHYARAVALSLSYWM